MKIRYKKRLTMNDVTFIYIMFIALVGGYIISTGWGGPLWTLCTLGTFVFVLIEYFLFGGFNKETFYIILIGSLIFAMFLIINYITGSDRGFARRNLTEMLKPLIAALSVMLLARNVRFNFFNKLKNCFWLFNLWGVLNMIVLTLQLVIKGFMMQPEWLVNNTYYEDLCAGLFGYNGTHRLGIYMTFLFLYNLYMAEFETKGKMKKNRLYVYNFIILIWHFILSTQNDNMAIYIITALFFVSYMYLKIHWQYYSINRIIMKWIKYVSVVLVAVVFILMIPSVRNFVLDGVMKRVSSLLTTTSSSGLGSTERISILLYSFENGFGYRMGKGIGYVSFFGDSVTTNKAVTGFLHFGISSLTSMVYLMGIWFYIFYIVWNIRIYQGMSKHKDKRLFTIILFLMIFLTFYTTNLTSLPGGVCIHLLFSLFFMLEESINRRD